MPEIERRLADIRQRFEKLAERAARLAAPQIPEGEYRHGGNGTADVEVVDNGKVVITMTWKKSDTYKLTATWDEKISKHKGTGEAIKNERYPKGIPEAIKTFDIWLEYQPQKKGILIRAERAGEWRMDGIFLAR